MRIQLIGLAGVALLALSGCSGAAAPPGASGTVPSQPITAQPTPTGATAQKTVAPTAEARPATPRPTALSAATPSGTAGGPGSVLLQDDFSGPTPNWFLGTVKNGSLYEYQNAAYHIKVPVDAIQSAVLSITAADTSVEVDANLAGGPDDGRFGVLCRGDKVGNGTGYFLAISPNNLYGIYRNTRDTPLTIAQYQAQKSPIKAGSAVNHLRADCVGPTLSLYVNGTKLLEVQDTAYTSGALGLMAGAGVLTKRGADVLFHNFVAREAAAVPPASPAPAATPPVLTKKLLDDKFADPNSGWTRRSDADVTSDYAGGAYHIAINKTDTRTLAFLKQTFRDVSIEVDTSLKATPGFDSYGLICRAGDDNNYYTFAIGSDGFWAITKVKGDARINLAYHEVQLSAIKQGTLSNHIRADCISDQLSLYVNGQKLDQVQDAEFTQGSLGLSAYSDKGFDLLFTNFVARGP